jgi:hypothetical protein
MLEREDGGLNGSTNLELDMYRGRDRRGKCRENRPILMLLFQVGRSCD